MVGLEDELVDLGLVEGAAEIDGHLGLAEVETDVVITEMGVGEAGEDVLAAVLLHDGKTPGPVELGGISLTWLQRFIRVMYDGWGFIEGDEGDLFIVSVEDAGFADKAGIARLATSFRIEECVSAGDSVGCTRAMRLGEFLARCYG